MARGVFCNVLIKDGMLVSGFVWRLARQSAVDYWWQRRLSVSILRAWRPGSDNGDGLAFRSSLLLSLWTPLGWQDLIGIEVDREAENAS